MRMKKTSCIRVKLTRYKSNRKRPAHTSKGISLFFDTFVPLFPHHLDWFEISLMMLCLHICHFSHNLPIPLKSLTFSKPATYLKLFHFNENIADKPKKNAIAKCPVSHSEKGNANIFSMLWRKIGNVKRNREKGFNPISKGALFRVSRKFGSYWERYDFSQTLADVHPCSKSQIVFTICNSLLSGWG